MHLFKAIFKTTTQSFLNPQTFLPFIFGALCLAVAATWLPSSPGGGKPIGFGSVRLDIAWENTALETGEAWSDFYRSLFADEPHDLELARACITRYKDAITAYHLRSFIDVPYIAAFLQAAQGFTDGLPIHYPRARRAYQALPVPPHPEGVAYEWFVANEQQYVPALSLPVPLPDITTDHGLPMLYAEKVCVISFSN